MQIKFTSSPSQNVLEYTFFRMYIGFPIFSSIIHSHDLNTLQKDIVSKVS